MNPVGCAEQERAQANLTEAEIQAEHERYFKWFKDSVDYPHITRLMELGVDPDDPDTREERFQSQPSDCVLDGVARPPPPRHPHRPPAPSARPLKVSESRPEPTRSGRESHSLNSLRTQAGGVVPVLRTSCRLGLADGLGHAQGPRVTVPGQQ